MIKNVIRKSLKLKRKLILSPLYKQWAFFVQIVSICYNKDVNNRWEARVVASIKIDFGGIGMLNVSVGLVKEVNIVVAEKDTAAAFGSGSIFVLATPMMITLMENAALQAVQEVLPEGYTTVGTHLDVSHLAATPMGMEARAVAELIEVEGKRLKFKVSAYDAKDKIGEGFHERYIVEIEKFMNRINNK